MTENRKAVAWAQGSAVRIEISLVIICTWRAQLQIPMPLFLNYSYWSTSWICSPKHSSICWAAQSASGPLNSCHRASRVPSSAPFRLSLWFGSQMSLRICIPCFLLLQFASISFLFCAFLPYCDHHYCFSSTGLWEPFEHPTWNGKIMIKVKWPLIWMSVIENVCKYVLL